MAETDDPDDDQRWLALLAGRSAPDALHHTRQEAAWLRAALLAYKQAPLPGPVPDAALRVQRLIARAVAAGVLPATPRASAGSRLMQTLRLRWRPATPLRWAGAAAMLMLALGLTFRLLLPAADPPEAPVLRGADRVTLTAADPLAARQRLQQELQRAGISAAPYEQLGRPGLDLDLPVPLPPAQAAALQKLGLQAPAGASLRVEFVGIPAETASGARP